MSEPVENSAEQATRLSKTGRILLGISFILLAVLIHFVNASESEPYQIIVWSVSILCGLLGVGCLLADPTSGAWISMDCFLPFLRKKKKNEVLATDGVILRVAKVILPKRLFADRIAGKPGLLRKLLKKIGPVTYSSPLRRVVQAVCFLTFLYLFFVVCWPYGAQPAATGPVSSGWSFSEIRQSDGALSFQRVTSEGSPVDPTRLPVESSFELVLDREAGPTGFGRFTIVNADDVSLVVTADGELTDDLLDALFTASDSWSFHDQPPDAWPDHYAAHFQDREIIPAESFLVIDPLVSISTAIASNSWVWSIVCAAAILIVCIAIPRGFCGYICPLGTLIDFFDWSVGKRVKKVEVPSNGWWVHVKYYLLGAILISSTLGILISGYFAAIPVITRGLMFIGEPLQSGVAREWRLVPPIGVGHIISISLFAGVLLLGFLKPRFWCKYVCPSGAVFSIGNLFRISERKVESSCIHCDKCIEICPFDAIKPDYTTRVTDCTLCQSCAGVCPTKSIKFVERWNLVELKVEDDPPTHETKLGRRGFMSMAAGSTAAVVGGVSAAVVTGLSSGSSGAHSDFIPVRPPGSVPEREFLEMCIRCAECFKVCPNNVLQSEGFQQGLAGLWTPMVDANWAGCDSSCNACGQVCPTGAIRPLPLEEKRVARMGLAIVNKDTCLPFADTGDCDLCVQECVAAGYDAIEYINVGTEVDALGNPIEGSGRLAPVVIPDKCVGCGLCQTRCYAINVKEEQHISESAIIIEAGEGYEDRMMDGSYIELRASDKPF